MQLMQMNYVRKHSQDCATSGYVSCVRVNCKGAEFTGNKQIQSLTNKHANNILVQKVQYSNLEYGHVFTIQRYV